MLPLLLLASLGVGGALAQTFSSDRLEDMPTTLVENELLKAKNKIRKLSSDKKKLEAALPNRQEELDNGRERLSTDQRETAIVPLHQPKRFRRSDEDETDEDRSVDEANRAMDEKYAAQQAEMADLERSLPALQKNIEDIQHALVQIDAELSEQLARYSDAKKELERRGEKVEADGKSTLWNRAAIGTTPKTTGNLDKPKLLPLPEDNSSSSAGGTK